MINGGRVSEDTKNLVEFIRSLPSAKNIRVYSHEQCGVRVSTMDANDPLPTENDARAAIETVQAELTDSLPELHAEWHHSLEGFEHDEGKAQAWVAATKEILRQAYHGQVPESAFVCGYSA